MQSETEESMRSTKMRLAVAICGEQPCGTGGGRRGRRRNPFERGRTGRRSAPLGDEGRLRRGNGKKAKGTPIKLGGILR